MRRVAVLLLIAACTSAPPAPGTPPNVSLTISSALGIPSGAGLHVAFIDADGTVAADVMTDQAGKAQAAIEPGASVTADLGGVLQTILDIQPGDALQMGVAQPTLGSPDHALTINFQPPTGADNFQIAVPCSYTGGDASPLQVFVSAACADHGPLLALAGGGNALTAYVVEPDVALVEGSHTITAPWKPIDQTTTTVQGIDAAKIDNIQMQATTSLDFITDNINSLPLTASTTTVTMPAALDLRSGVVAFVGTKTSHAIVMQPFAPGATTTTIDLAKDLLATITGATYDASSRTVAISTDGGPAGALLDLSLHYGPGLPEKFWDVVGPVSGQVVLPTLPASFDATEPMAGAAVTVDAHELDVDGETYDSLRAQAADLLDRYTTAVHATPPTRVRID